MIIENEKHALDLDPYGAGVRQWLYDNETHLFYPRGRVLVNGVPKIRGGMHGCFPPFGLPEAAVKAKLPQHGTIRDMWPHEKPLHRENWAHLDFVQKFPWNEEYPFAWKYRVALEARVNGFNHNTNIARLPQEHVLDKQLMPVNPALHPYLAVQEGDLIEIGDWKHNVTGDPFGPKVMSMPNKPIHITLHNRGTIRMTPSGYRKVIAWTDDRRYFCVEFALDEPQKFGTPEGQYLSIIGSDWPRELDLGCLFEFMPW